MAQYKINVDEQLLQGLFRNNEGLAKLISQVLNPVLESEVSEVLGAERYERNQERRGYRNGTRSKKLISRVGEVSLNVPQVRNASFSSALFDRYQRSEQAFVSTLIEMVVNGVSTRKVQNITQELCGNSFSKSTVSELCKELDPIVKAWRDRPLEADAYPFLLVDAMVIKVRSNMRVIPQSLFTATAINNLGYREVIGFHIGDSESEESWSAFFSALKQRGLRGVDLVISDQHAGLVKAARTHFQGASWQRCQTHFMRNLMDACPKGIENELRERIRCILNAPDAQAARLLFDQLADQYGQKAPKTIERLEEGLEDAIAHFAVPMKYRRQLRTTNTVERLNAEVRRREQVIRIFPNLDSAVRLIGAVLMEQNENYLERPYFNMDEYWESRRKAN
jgi:putative transposase